MSEVGCGSVGSGHAKVKLINNVYGRLHGDRSDQINIFVYKGKKTFRVFFCFHLLSATSYLVQYGLLVGFHGCSPCTDHGFDRANARAQ